MMYYRLLMMKKFFNKLTEEEENLKHINFFEEFDDIEFKMRFRLSKESVLLILENITKELEFLTNK